jgi:hypothetical protein
MSHYPDQKSRDIVENLLRRREYFVLKASPPRSAPLAVTAIDDLSEKIDTSARLSYTTYQLYIARLFSPYTALRTMLLKWGTGLGKTRCALGVAMQFVQKYRSEVNSGAQDTGSVFVVGFNDRIFRMELLKFPEFGFVTAEERSLDEKLRKSAIQGNMSDYEKLKELRTAIKKRFGSRKGNGFFRFIGYREFVNRLFPEASALENLTEDDLRVGIKNGSITINKALATCITANSQTYGVWHCIRFSKTNPPAARYS